MTRIPTAKEIIILNAESKKRGFKDIYEMDSLIKDLDKTCPVYVRWMESGSFKSDLVKVIGEIRRK